MTASLPRRLDAPWLREGGVSDLLTVLDRDGEEARVVGGAVRNALLGEQAGDIDIATTAVPETVVARVEAAGLKAVPTGVEHGTVTVVMAGKPFEVTTLRQDVESYGRKAKVAFGRDWRVDAERRDFTINALSVSRDGTLHDYVDGLADLALRRVRFIGDPQQRIAEDYLRILRFFRFHAAYGDGVPDASGLHACIVSRAGLGTLSRERVRSEMIKLLLARGAAATLRLMADSGLLISVLGGVPLLGDFGDVLDLEAAMGFAGDPVRRLGALAVLVTEDAERLWQRLRLTNAEYERLRSMAEQWRSLSPKIGAQGARALLYRLGRENFVDRVLIAWSRAGADASDAAWHELASLPAHWSAPKFPLKSADFVRRGVPKGPALGAALRAAEEAWIAADFPTDPSALAAIAAQAARGETS